jgi:hypothetical protein
MIVRSSRFVALLGWFASFVSFAGVVVGCSKENDVELAGDQKTVNATCVDLCGAIGRGDFGDCEGKIEDYGKNQPACVAECNDHIQEGKSSQSGLNCAIDLSKERGGDRCQRLADKECGDFF